MQPAYEMCLAVGSAIAAAMSEPPIVISAILRGTDTSARQHCARKVFPVVIGGSDSVIPRASAVCDGSGRQPGSVWDGSSLAFGAEQLHEELDWIVCVDRSRPL